MGCSSLLPCCHHHHRHCIICNAHNNNNTNTNNTNANTVQIILGCSVCCECLLAVRTTDDSNKQA
jgi:hypothetical protein